MEELFGVILQEVYFEEEGSILEEKSGRMN
jgi:hypothetical protein